MVDIFVVVVVVVVVAAAAAAAESESDVCCFPELCKTTKTSESKKTWSYMYFYVLFRCEPSIPRLFNFPQFPVLCTVATNVRPVEEITTQRKL